MKHLSSDINKPDRLTNKLELWAVVLTAMGKFVFVDWLDLKFWFITVACLGWLMYVLWQLTRHPAKVRLWGFRRQGFRESLKMLLPYALLSLSIFITYGMWSNETLINWHIIPVLLLYPLWGTIQHFLLIALVTGNLTHLKKPKLSKGTVIFLAAALFSLVHYPSYLLMAATFLLAAVYVNTYIKFANLWALGLVHGWLGAFFYYLVLGRDTWLEFTKVLF